MGSKLKILITTGDPDGIGWEVTVKALNRLGPASDVQFSVFRDSSAKSPKPSISRKFKVHPVHSINQAVQAPFDGKLLVEVRSDKPAALWVEDAALACLRGDFDALVTAPLSKTSVISAGLKDIGHTEILGRISKTDDLYMGFLGSEFSVLLATGHLPLHAAVQSFTAARLHQALRAAHQMRQLLSPKKRRLPIAVVGLNPHAGEHGLLGGEEAWMKHAIQEANKRLGGVTGPFVPDAAFLRQNWKGHSVYVCPYHDQGLIPFKMVHGFKSGVHLTLGLPFVRTSVDHGTAKELFGKNKAESGSMEDAITTAIRLSKESRKLTNDAKR